MIAPHPYAGQNFKRLRIGLLGGSFNPAHEGHREMSLYALKHLNLDQVWWLVTPQNPLKSKANMNPLAQRLAAARTVAAHPRIVVTDIERQFKTSRTVESLHHLQRRFRDTQFIWLMGADNLRQLPLWYKGMDIFRLVPVAVFRRPAYAVGRGWGPVAQHFRHAWRRQSREIGGQTGRGGRPLWTILPNRLNPISATQIRKDH
jgi:nicotinate-nucleotide adenylyltransferase